jgi:nucleoside-diphosphate-sugar epimerase
MIPASRLLLTGSTGFIGKHILDYFRCLMPVLAISKRELLDCVDFTPSCGATTQAACRKLFDFAPSHIIHCAALAHKAYPRTVSKLKELEDVNVLLPIRLAKLAIDLGTRHYIFMSSIGVHGASTAIDECISEDSLIVPMNPYAKSKYAAEEGIKLILDDSMCKLTVLRPALVYGQGMPGNFRSLIQAVDAGYPLPFKYTQNLRSFVAIENLISLIEAIILHPSQLGGTYVVSDEELISTPELIHIIAAVRGRPCRLFGLPESVFRLSRGFPYVGTKLNQLTSSLVVNSIRIRSQLGWRQPFSQDRAMRKAFLSY